MHTTKLRLRRRLLSLALLFCPLLIGPLAMRAQVPEAPPTAFSDLFNEACAVCHGVELHGEAQGVPLIGQDLLYGDSIPELEQSIARGSPELGMPVWSETLTPDQIHNLALYIAERRSNFSYLDFRITAELKIPEGVIQSQEENFRLETVIADLDPLPSSIAPLPDGRILLTEKMRGLSIVSQDGIRSDYIRGAPKTYDDALTNSVGSKFGLGWLLEVAIHPDYASNGWVYLLYGDRCEDCNTYSRAHGVPVSMVKVIRGHVRDGAWTDEQVIYQADIEDYGPAAETGAAGRICFDHAGHMFISIGMKGTSNYDGIQDLGKPYGKTLRLNDDGTIPPDNPFVGRAGALPAIWTYGHRSHQGLEFDRRTGRLWSTEMGPRGGDEVNLLRPGRNYGWPLTSKGVNYDGTPVEYGKLLGIEFNMDDIEQPVVDLTPSPAIASFIFYTGNAFPKWRDQMIVGSLKGTNLYRMVTEGDRVVHTEVLLRGFARIKDVEMGPAGEIYLLLEHGAGGRIIRMVPAG